MKFFILSLAFMMICSVLSADVNDLPTKVINGATYHYYEVQPKETVYSLCRRFGISKEDLYRDNPEVAHSGLKAGETLVFKASAKPVRVVTLHVVKKGDTIYGISKSYGVTPAQLEQWNPGIRENLKPGMKIYVSEPLTLTSAIGAEVAKSAAAPAKPADAPAKTPGRYKVKKGETFYSVAHKHGLSVAQLEEANPGLGILREGQELVIPSEGATDRQKLSVSNDSEPVTTTSSENPAPASVAVKDVNIAVMLPFMLENSDRQRQAQIYLEFYKGFLLAVDSLRNSARPINIYAYDTAGSADTVRKILTRPEMKNIQVFVAPENEKQLEMIARYADESNASVLNMFAVRDGSYKRHASMLQATIPHQDMYQKAVEAMVKDMKGREVVVVNPAGREADKKEFVDMLKSALAKNGTSVTVINYDVNLDMDQLSDFDRTKKYAFITTSSRQPELNRVLPTLIEFKDQLTDTDPLKLFGYPEWTTFRGETLNNMHLANTYVYSRFYTVPEDPWAEKLEKKFVADYGTPMGSYVPRQGLLGFDTGLFLLKWLENAPDLNEARNSIITYNGVQNGFHFVRPDRAAGLVNNDLYFVNFRPSGLVDRIAL